MGPSGYSEGISVELETQNLNFSFYCFSTVNITGYFGDTNHSFDDYVLVICCHLTTLKQEVKNDYHFIIPHKFRNLYQEFQHVSIVWFFYLRWHCHSVVVSQWLEWFAEVKKFSCMWLVLWQRHLEA